MFNRNVLREIRFCGEGEGGAAQKGTGRGKYRGECLLFVLASVHLPSRDPPIIFNIPLLCGRQPIYQMNPVARLLRVVMFPSSAAPLRSGLSVTFVNCTSEFTESVHLPSRYNLIIFNIPLLCGRQPIYQMNPVAKLLRVVMFPSSAAPLRSGLNVTFVNRTFELTESMQRRIIDTTIFCGENEIPLRGHWATDGRKPFRKGGNFQALLGYRSKLSVGKCTGKTLLIRSSAALDFTEVTLPRHVTAPYRNTVITLHYPKSRAQNLDMLEVGLNYLHLCVVWVWTSLEAGMFSAKWHYCFGDDSHCKNRGLTRLGPLQLKREARALQTQKGTKYGNISARTNQGSTAPIIPTIKHLQAALLLSFFAIYFPALASRFLLRPSGTMKRRSWRRPRQLHRALATTFLSTVCIIRRCLGYCRHDTAEHTLN
ncbi:hypothetical protein J6590_027023 [Homalodisca vitripennis]|nr:hypothetical protein J6590_027023 [Homalodisca vitripennis]